MTLYGRITQARGNVFQMIIKTLVIDITINRNETKSLENYMINFHIDTFISYHEMKHCGNCFIKVNYSHMPIDKLLKFSSHERKNKVQ